MGAGRRMVFIDADKLRKELLVRKLTFEGVGIELGYGKTYMNNCFRLGRVAHNVMQMLQMRYNIDPDSYVLKEEPKKVVEESKETFESVTKEDLYKIIYSAVYEAVKQALTE